MKEFSSLKCSSISSMGGHYMLPWSSAILVLGTPLRRCSPSMFWVTTNFTLTFLFEFGTKWFTAITTWELWIWYLFCLNKFCQSHVGEGGFGLNIIIGYFYFGFDPSLIFLTSSQDTFMLGFSPFFSRVHTPLGPLKHNVKLRRSSTSQIGVGRPKFDLKSWMPAEVEMPAPV